MLDIIELFFCWLRAYQVAHSLFEKHVDVRLRLFDAHIGFATSDDVKRLEKIVMQPLPAWRKQLLHRERDPYVWRLAHRTAKKFVRSDTDDGINRRSDTHFFADDRRVASETPYPPSVAAHGHWTAPGNPIVIIGESAARIGLTPSAEKYVPETNLAWIASA